MFGLYSLILSVVASLVVGSIVFMHSRRDAKIIIYSFLTVVITTLSVANFLAVESVDNQLFYIRIVMFAATIGVYLIYILTRYIGRRVIVHTPHEKALLYFTIMVAIIAWSDWLFPDVIPGHPPTPIPGPATILYFGHFALLIMLAIRRLLLGYKKSSTRERQQRKLLIAGMLPILFFAPMTSFILPNMFGIGQLVALTPLYAFIFVACVGYAIVRHGLFDIKTAVVRSVAYSLSLLTLAGVYFGLAYLVSIVFLGDTAAARASTSLVNVSLALILAFVFQPVLQFFNRATDRIFFRGRYDTDEFIARLGGVLTSTTRLKTLLQRTSAELASTFRASYALFTVYRDDKEDATVGTERSPHFTSKELSRIHALVVSLDGQVLVIDRANDSIASEHQSHDELVQMLRRRHVALLVPLSGHVGYLMLGDALSGKHAQRDVKTLNAIGDELVIAIQNARSVQEVRELNTHLQQRIDQATRELRASNSKLRKLDETKDEFVSMASHQLRTPLTSVKGYLSMVLEGDVGAVNPGQQKVLSEAYASSERMVRLISDFLNVSRLQTGKFVIDAHPTDLAGIIGEEVEAMRQLAESHDMTLVYKPPKKFPVLNVDADKMRQVVMNFIDNAIYYSRPKSTIVVKAYLERDDVVVEVHDQGIGVPKAQQEQLFTKFFRAENARKQRPDGTGVGLFLARKVVTAQGGEIVFSSREGRGSVFGFRLPIGKLEVK